MIGRIRERREFERLTRHGRRARSNTLWCRYLDDSSVVPPRVGFAIGRAVGTAASRNRLRRRLRELARAATSGEAPSLTHGVLLIGAVPGAGELSFDDLAGEVTMLLRTLHCSPRAASSGDVRANP